MPNSEASSPVLHLHISATDGSPIYLQIVHGVRLLVASGRLVSGQELPPIRVLAERLVVNPNTVARAYRELEVAGLVEKRRTAGTYVAECGPTLTVAERHRILAERVDGLLAEAKQLSVPTDELIQIVVERDAKLSERPNHEGVAN